MEHGTKMQRKHHQHQVKWKPTKMNLISSIASNRFQSFHYELLSVVVCLLNTMVTLIIVFLLTTQTCVLCHLFSLLMCITSKGLWSDPRVARTFSNETHLHIKHTLGERGGKSCGVMNVLGLVLYNIQPSNYCGCRQSSCGKGWGVSQYIWTLVRNDNPLSSTQCMNVLQNH